MPKFIEIPARKNSTVQRKLIQGVGINNAGYAISNTINGKMTLCPFYSVWTDMISRCYSEKYHNRRPTYKDCTVIKEWLTFSNFKRWMRSQDWKGKHLDKDIINPGNKIYSSINCCFVSVKINSLLLDCGASRGKYPKGVTFDTSKGRILAQCRVNGKEKFLGYFSTPEEASRVYNKFKSDLVTKTANEQSNLRVKNGLLKHAKLILEGKQNEM